MKRRATQKGIDAKAQTHEAVGFACEAHGSRHLRGRPTSYTIILNKRGYAILLLGLALASCFAEPEFSNLSLPPNSASAGSNLLSSALRVPVIEFWFKGNTVFSDAQLSEVVSNWTHRVITSAELEEARRALTLYYVNHGYINSGAVLDDQPVSSGVITFRIVEGRLSEVEVKPANNWLSSSYVRNRILLGAGPPLNMNRLQENLLLLRDNPNVARINAELKPGVVPGESVLDVQVKEKSPFRLAFEARNDRPPGVGEDTLEAQLGDVDLTGHGDALEVRWGILHAGNDTVEFAGIDDFGASYTLPLTARDTTLRFSYNRSDYAVVQAPFNTLDIQSQTESYLVGLRQPLYRTVNRELAVGIEGNWLHSESSLLGQPFSFSTGAVNGAETVSVLRLVQEYVNRKQEQVLALRSAFSIGLDVLGATRNPTRPDGRFVTWLGQAQYVRRLGNTANQLVLSTSFQWSDSPLLSLQQFGLGGPNTVRGYEVNQLVRDSGWVGTAELRVPLIFNGAGAALVQLAPFFDAGAGWNVERPTPPPPNLTSAGIGLLLTPWERFSAQVYWGYAFRDLNDGRSSLQDLGISFRVRLVVF